jgi:glycosyltransferase involved in cell wall biosynthesis
LVPTHNLARDLSAAGYRNLAVVSRGVDTTLFHPTRRSAALRALWGIPAGGLAVCHVGRMAPEKNLDLVLRAFDAIHAVRPDARLVFVGDGPLRRPMARRHPQHVFAGLRRGEDLATHYASCDLFLFPSLTETYGNVTAEALASGLGVVAYDCAAAADLVVDGRNGCLAQAGDAAAFIEAAVRLAAEAEGLAQARMEAAPSVAHLDWDRVHDRLVSVLRERIAGHRGGVAVAKAGQTEVAA